MNEFNFENAEGAETRTKKLNILEDMVNDYPLTNLGMTAMPPVLQSSTTTYTKVTVMDTIRVERGDISASISLDNIEIEVDGIYQVSPSINVASAGSSELVFSIFVDGLQIGEEVYLQGQGNSKPAFVGGTYFVEFTKGQTIDMRFKSATSATGYFYSCGLAIKKI